jgi:hypothetical protein
MDGVRAIDWFGCLSVLGLTLMLLLGLDFGGETFEPAVISKQMSRRQNLIPIGA